MRSIFILLLFLATLAPALLKPHVGVLVWSWISYMNPHRLAWGGFVNDLPMLDLVAGVTIVSMVVAREKLKLSWSPLLIVLIALTGWMFTTSLFSQDLSGFWGRFDRFYKVMLFTFITIMLINKRSRLDAFIYVMMLSVGFFGAKGGFFTVLTGGQHIVVGPPKSMLEDRNQLAVGLIMLLPLCFYIYSHGRHKLIRFAAMGALPLLAAASLGTQSRGALVALGAVGLFLLLRMKQRIPVLAFLAAFSFLALFFLPETWVDRMMTIQNYEEDGSAIGRLQTWAYAWRVALDHPIIGTGFGTFTDGNFAIPYISEGARLRASHSIYYEVLAEHGFIGLFLFILVGVTGFLSCQKIIKLTKPHPDLLWAKDLAIALQGSLVAYAVGGAFLAMSLFDLYYHFIALVIITYGIVTRSLQAKEQSGAKPPYAAPHHAHTYPGPAEGFARKSW